VRISLFTPSPKKARAELLAKGLFEDGQIKVVDLATYASTAVRDHSARCARRGCLL
jgi:hypothetical protein